MNEAKQDSDWVSSSITVGLCLLTALANPWVSMSSALAAMVFLAYYYRRRYPDRVASTVAAAGAAVLLAGLVVLWLATRS